MYGPCSICTAFTNNENDIYVIFVNRLNWQGRSKCRIVTRHTVLKTDTIKVYCLLRYHTVLLDYKNLFTRSILTLTYLFIYSSVTTQTPTLVLEGPSILPRNKRWNKEYLETIHIHHLLLLNTNGTRKVPFYLRKIKILYVLLHFWKLCFEYTKKSCWLLRNRLYVHTVI